MKTEIIKINQTDFVELKKIRFIYKTVEYTEYIYSLIYECNLNDYLFIPGSVDNEFPIEENKKEYYFFESKLIFHQNDEKKEFLFKFYVLEHQKNYYLIVERINGEWVMEWEENYPEKFKELAKKLLHLNGLKMQLVTKRELKKIKLFVEKNKNFV